MQSTKLYADENFKKIVQMQFFGLFLENENYASCAMMQKVQICTLMQFDIHNKRKNVICLFVL